MDTHTRASLDAVSAQLGRLADQVAGLAARVDALAGDAPPFKGDLTTAQACAYLNVSRGTLYAWARRARIRRVRASRKLVRWPKAELDRMVRLSTRTTR